MIHWVALLFLFAVTNEVPKENQEKGTPPSFASAETLATKLLDAVQTGDPTIAADGFFPQQAFSVVKNSADPERYHRKLVKWYEEDILKEHLRFKTQCWTFESFEPGRCKWKDIGSEQNKVAYWSCIGNFITARCGDKKRRFEIRVLINWGSNWYVTHLGPIR